MAVSDRPRKSIQPDAFRRDRTITRLSVGKEGRPTHSSSSVWGNDTTPAPCCQGENFSDLKRKEGAAASLTAAGSGGKLIKHLPVWWNGRHQGLKIPWSKGRARSSRVTGTTSEFTPHGSEMAIAKAVAISSSVLRGSSFPNRTRCAGLRFGVWRRQILKKAAGTPEKAVLLLFR